MAATKRKAGKSSAAGKAAASGSATGKGPTKQAAAEKASAKPPAAEKAPTGDAPTGDAPPKKLSGAAAVAQRLIEEGPASAIAEHGANLVGGAPSAATQSARVLGEIVARKPSAAAPLVDRFVTGILSKNKRVVQACADALPAIAKVAPARVAKHLERLTRSFDAAGAVGRDGLVRTFANLCAASVAYQKRLEPVLKTALSVADGKVLVGWTQTVLPALKGEPHANARAVVERRLYEIPRRDAQLIADFLGIRLRTRR